jgi:hypothetical protein
MIADPDFPGSCGGGDIVKPGDLSRSDFEMF